MCCKSKKIKDHCKIYTFISAVVSLSFFASILAKGPQNLTVSLLIIPHQLVRDEILRVELVLWSLNYFATLPQNVVLCCSLPYTRSTLVLSHVATSNLSSLGLKLIPCIVFFLELATSSFSGESWINMGLFSYTPNSYSLRLISPRKTSVYNE